MKSFETNDWLVLNSIIYKIYTTNDFDGMRKQFLEQIKTVIDFDSADFYLASARQKEQLEKPVFFNCDEDLSDIYESIDYSRGLCSVGAAWSIARPTLFPMRNGSIQSITDAFTGRTTGIMRCR